MGPVMENRAPTTTAPSSDAPHHDTQSSPRASALLLHPTSLPGRFAIGDLGPGALAALDWMAAAGFTVWQVLPLGPPAFAGAPYACLSSFAANPLLISPEALVEDGLLEERDLEGAPPSVPGRCDFAATTPWKDVLLRRAWQRFTDGAAPELRPLLAEFEQRQAGWLEDWALFAALRERFDQRSWWEWDDDALRRHEPEALARATEATGEQRAYHRFVQFLFFRQWGALRRGAAERGLRILGDLPIYVALDSAEVWANRPLFELDEEGRPLAVAGVPPDYFSPTGQLWGNPLYRWDRMAQDGFTWWQARLAANLELVDIIRLDHFRAFADYWRVPAGAANAIHGEWVDGPGGAFFDALGERFGQLPLLAENLGDLSPAVDELRRAYDLPGMAVLQFAFDGHQNSHLPHLAERRSAIYTGTHDNETTLGWYRGLDNESRHRFHVYTGATGEHDAAWAMIRQAFTSVAELAVVPLQDVLSLGNEARMNTPGVPDGNWIWRAGPDAFGPDPVDNLRTLAIATGRLVLPEEDAGTED